jgi:hypothetical protein
MITEAVLEVGLRVQMELKLAHASLTGLGPHVTSSVLGWRFAK